MKIPYKLLIHHKEPIIYFEYCRIRMRDGILTAVSKTEKLQIAPAKHLLIIMGAGTSITQEAIIFCGQHNCHLAIARGGCYIHSYWMSGRWTEPKNMVHQAVVHHDPIKRLEYAKELIKYRFIKENAHPDYLSELANIKTQESLLNLEARWAKDLYRIKKITYNVDFVRDKNSRQGLNARVTLLNNALYSLTTAIILNCGLHPSVGLIHGQTRRGGFSFDLADIFKNDLSLDLAFKYRNSDFKYTIIKLNNKLKENDFENIKEMVKICSWLGGDIGSIC